MRLTIFGATGGTGRQLVTQGLAAGHQVVAAARRPEDVGITDERLTVLRADVLDQASLAKPVAGADAVISAIGIGYSRAATQVYSAGTANIMAAMRQAGVCRLLCVSTAGLVVPADAPLPQRLFARQVLHRLLRNPYHDMTRMEEAVRGSGLDWTIVRAARLTNGAAGRYRTAVNGFLRGSWSISRADLGGYLLGHLDDKACYGVTVEIAY